MSYHVNNFDDSAPGMERLRNRSEFILIACPWEDSTAEDIRKQWLQDIQSCGRFDGFDYDAARQAVESWCDDNSYTLSRALDYLQSELDGQWDEIADYGEGPVFRLYVETGRDTEDLIRDARAAGLKVAAGCEG